MEEVGIGCNSWEQLNKRRNKRVARKYLFQLAFAICFEIQAQKNRGIKLSGCNKYSVSWLFIVFAVQRIYHFSTHSESWSIWNGLSADCVFSVVRLFFHYGLWTIMHIQNAQYLILFTARKWCSTWQRAHTHTLNNVIVFSFE